MLPYEKTHLYKCPVKFSTAFLLVASFSPLWLYHYVQRTHGKGSHYSSNDQALCGNVWYNWLFSYAYLESGHEKRLSRLRAKPLLTLNLIL